MLFSTKFTNQYSLSKTLRFKLKPISETLEWIKQNNIINHDNNVLTGKDAQRAENYKYLKKMLDYMHQLFINKSLKNISPNQHTELQGILTAMYRSYDSNESPLDSKYVSPSNNKTIDIKKGLADVLAHGFTETINEWVLRYHAEMIPCWQADIDELNNKIEKQPNKQKHFASIIKKLEKKIQKSPLKVVGYKDLFTKNEQPLLLLEWLIRSEQLFIKGEDVGKLDEEYASAGYMIKNIIRSFDGFSTYIIGFNENRANVYNLKDFHSTSIMYRCFEQNVIFHFDNYRKLLQITQFLKDNTSQLAERGIDWEKALARIQDERHFSISEIFAPESFSKFLSQDGINTYNQYIGGTSAQAGKSKEQGLNEFINLMRQQLGAKRYQMPNLQLFYKQILSKDDKTFITAFESDTDLIDAINDFVEAEINNQDSSINIFKANLTAFTRDAIEASPNIYLKKDMLTKASGLFGLHWSGIAEWRQVILTDKAEVAANKMSFLSIEELMNWLNTEIEGESFYSRHQVAEKLQEKGLVVPELSKGNEVFFTLFNAHIEKLFADMIAAKQAYLELSLTNKIDVNRSEVAQTGFKQVAIIKSLMDSANALSRFVADYRVLNKDKLPEDRADFWYDELQQFVDEFPIFELYNKTRNYLTQKPFSTEKVKLNFENGTLLDGWDRNKETANCGVLFERDGDYYLGIMPNQHNRIFERNLSEIAAQNDEVAYRKVNYKLLPGANKMLPKVFFAKSNLDIFKPTDEIIAIKEKKLYSKEQIAKHGIENLHKYVDFCKTSLVNHPEWGKAFGFTQQSFTPTKDYTSVDQFYREVEHLGYRITFDVISPKYIDEKVKNGELYLFQIYNKDFSKAKSKKGTDNLHTIYWKQLFSPDNLSDPVYKLNGQAEIFFRPASLEYEEHKRQKGHHTEALKGKFEYPILKDKRYSNDQFMFHCPITLNMKAEGLAGGINKKIWKFIQDNQSVNIIGIDRGEKHLLYYSVIDQNGNILEQGSWNTITNSYQNRDGIVVERHISYHKKLDDIEAKRAEARKSWQKIDNIKELKSGYLSHVVHQLAKLIIKHNAIVVLEDLNAGFKRGRFKIEKQVYQKFEKALIDKLNFLVDKQCTNPSEAGHALKAYQLTNKFESFTKLGKQSGILFYVDAAYTSTTDPVTGFVKNIYPKYQSVAASQKFWQKFTQFEYIATEDRFELTYEVETKKPKDDELNKTQWTVSSHVTRSQYDKNTKDTELFVVTDKIKTILAKAGIGLESSNLLTEIIANNTKALHSGLIYCVNAIVSMRVTDPKQAKGTDANDFILSPVVPYFDSRHGHTELPENGDANGAYNIARKGLIVFERINRPETWNKEKPDLLIKANQWRNFSQKDSVVTKQLKKLK
jgi:hypothetical protein